MSPQIRVFLHVVLSASVFFIEGCSSRGKWIDQYPDDFKPISRPELMYTYNRDSIFVTGLTVLQISGIYASNNNEVWAADCAGDIYYSKGGTAFRELSVPASTQLNVLRGVGDEVWIGGVDGVMLHCKGAVCTRENLPGVPNTIWGLAIAKNTRNGWAWSNNGTVYRRHNNQWEYVDSIVKYRIHDLWTDESGEECWAAGNNFTLLHFLNGKWDTIRLHEGKEDLWNITMSADGKRGWTDGGRKTFMFENDKWRQDFISENGCGLIKASEDGTECWAVGDGEIFETKGDVYHYYDHQWHRLPIVTNCWAPQDIWFNKSECWIAAYKGTYHSSDLKYFSEIDPGEKEKSTTCIARNDHHMWLGGDDYNIFRINNEVVFGYPTLAAMRYNFNRQKDTVIFEFRFTAKQSGITKNAPTELWLNNYVAADTLHPTKINCPFTITETDSIQCVCKTSIPFGVLLAGAQNVQTLKAKLALSVRTEAGNEVMTYDLKDGADRFITLSK